MIIDVCAHSYHQIIMTCSSNTIAHVFCYIIPYIFTATCMISSQFEIVILGVANWCHAISALSSFSCVYDISVPTYLHNCNYIIMSKFSVYHSQNNSP